MAVTRPIEALPRGDFSPLFYPCPYGAHRFFPIIAQDFSPGSSSVPFFTRAPLGGTPLPLNNSPGLQSWEPCGPAESRQSRQSLYRGAAVEVEDLAGDEVGLGA